MFMSSPIIIPQNTKGRTIIIETGGYALSTGQTAVVFFKQSSGGANTNPQTASVTCTFADGATQCSYTTVGGEFASVPGLCDAQLMVYSSGMLDYSYDVPEYVLFQPPLGSPP